MAKLVFRVVLVIAVLVAATVVVRRAMRSEEELVRSAVLGLIADFESNNVLLGLDGIKDRLSKDYLHQGERADYAIDKQMALAYLYRVKTQMNYTDFRVEVRELKVSVLGPAATADFIGRITAARRGTPEERRELMTEPGRNRALLDLKKEDGRWLVSGSRRVEHRLED